VVSGAWDKFLHEEVLGNMMETITKTSVGATLYNFVHYGKRSRKLSELVTKTTLSSSLSKTPDSSVVHEEMQEEESVSSDEEDVTEGIIFSEYITLSATDAPCLSKVFGGESKVPKCYLNAILLELFKVLGHKSTASIDFEYKNGNKGRAVIIPCVKDEDSFRRQTQRKNGLKVA